MFAATGRTREGLLDILTIWCPDHNRSAQRETWSHFLGWLPDEPRDEYHFLFVCPDGHGIGAVADGPTLRDWIDGDPQRFFTLVDIGDRDMGVVRIFLCCVNCGAIRTESAVPPCRAVSDGLHDWLSFKSEDDMQQFRTDGRFDG